MPSLSTSFILLPTSDGSPMRAYIAKPEGPTPKQGIIVFQEAFGVNTHIRDVAERFAREGFLAIAPEIYHRTAPAGFECAYTDFEACRSHFDAVTPQHVQTDARAAFDWLITQGVDATGVSSIGFCLGGRASFFANATLPLKSAVCFYGGGIIDHLNLVPSLHAPTLFCWGGQDTHIPSDQTRRIADEMKKAEKPYTEVTFGEAGHAFFCDARGSYHERSASLAWPLVLAFLQQ